MIRFLQRDNSFQKWLLVFFLSIVSIGMVVTLIPGIFDFGNGTGSDQVYAKIGDEKITLQEINQQADQMARQQARGQALPPGFSDYFRPMVANGLVKQAVMREEARRIGLQVTDDEVIAFLKKGQTGEVLFPNGQFIGTEKYEDIISNNLHISVAEFEKRVKQEILTEKLMALVGAPAIVSPADADASYKKDHTKVKFQYAVVTLDDLKKELTPTDAELHAYYDAHKQDPEIAGLIKEQRKVNYIVVNSANVPAPQVTDADIKAYYDAHRDEFTTQQDTVDVRHILISPRDANGKVQARGQKLDDKAWEAARLKALDVLKQVKAGGDFAALAKKYSDDPGSKDNGGLYKGYQRGGGFVKPFEDTAFSLSKGQVSDLVKTDFGYHILKVDDKHTAGPKPLDEVKGGIRQTLATAASQKQIDAVADTLATDASKEGLEKAAAKNGLNVVGSSFFSRGDTLPGLGAPPEFMNTVFSSGPNSVPAKVKINDGYAIVQVVDKKPARTATFDEARTTIENDIKNQKAEELLGKRTQELADKAHSMNDLGKAAKELGVKFETSELVDSNTGQVPDIGTLSNSSANVAFSMTPGQISGPLNNGAAPSSVGGRFNPGSRATSGYVVQLVDKQEPTADEIQKNRDKTMADLQQAKTDQAVRLFQDELVRQMEESKKLQYNEDMRKKFDTNRFGGFGGMNF